MKVEEFESALKKGLGRAYQYVVEHGDSDELVRDWLEKACLENFTYDPQCEGDRSKWLYRILEQTSDIEHYERYIIEKLPTLTFDSSWDQNHIYGLLKQFSKHGSSAARELLYDHFSKNLRVTYNESWIGGSQIIDLDGLEGFLFVVRVIGENLIRTEDFSEDEYLLSEMIEEEDEDLVIDALMKASATCEFTKKYMDEVIPQYEESKRKETKDRIVRTASERRKAFGHSQEKVLEMIEDSSKAKKYPGFYMAYGRVATDEEIGQTIQKMLEESRPEQLIRYAWVFRRRYISKNKMPEPLFKKMLGLLDSSNVDLVEAVSYDLSYVDDERVRTIGIERLQNPSKISFCSVVKLLSSSIKQDDTQLLAECFLSIRDTLDECEIHECHGVIMDIINLADKLQVDVHLQTVLEHCYVLTPCSLCRDDVHAHLSKVDEKDVHLEIKEEHQFDSFE